METTASATLSDPWQHCFEALSQLPSQVLAELDEAWQSLTAYEDELAAWCQQLNDQYVHSQQHQEFDFTANPQPAVCPDVPTPPASLPPKCEPPQVMRTVSAAARQFAALRRQRTNQRPPQ